MNERIIVIFNHIECVTVAKRIIERFAQGQCGRTFGKTIAQNVIISQLYAVFNVVRNGVSSERRNSIDR